MLSFIHIFVTKSLKYVDFWYFEVILNTLKWLILVFSCMFDGIFKVLKINFYPQQGKSIPNIVCSDKNGHILYFGGTWGLFEKKIDKILQNLSLKKSLINTKSNPFSPYFWKIIIYFLEFIHNFHIFIDFSSLNDEFWKCYILAFKRVEY